MTIPYQNEVLIAMAIFWTISYLIVLFMPIKSDGSKPKNKRGLNEHIPN